MLETVFIKVFCERKTKDSAIPTQQPYPIILSFQKASCHSKLLRKEPKMVAVNVISKHFQHSHHHDYVLFNLSFRKQMNEEKENAFAK